MAEPSSVTTRHFQQEVQVPQDVANLMVLVPGEQLISVYATFRDPAILLRSA